VRARPRPIDSDLTGYFGLTVLLIPAAIIVSTLVVSLVLQGSASGWVLLLTGLLAATTMVARQGADLCQALGRTDAAIFSTLVVTATQLGAFGGMALLGFATTTTALVSAVVGAGVQAAYCSRVAQRSLGSLPRPGRGTLVDVLRVGFPGLGFSLGLVLLQRVDRLLLGAIAGPTALGVYAAAATLAEVVRLLPTTIGQLVFSRVAEHDGVPPDVHRLRRHLLLLTFASVLVLEVAAPLVPLLLGPAYEDAVSVFRVLLMAEFLLGSALVDSRISLGLGAVRRVGATTLVWVGVAIPAYAVGSWAGGAMGAAVATLGLYAGYALTLRARRPTSRAEEQ
jgi:O-antigen/teichoic acid export membrane protein